MDKSELTKTESPRRARRRTRLAELVAEFGGAAQVGREVGTPKSHLSALLAGNRGLGDDLAAKLEMAYNKPSGWFDSATATAALTLPSPYLVASGSGVDVMQSNVSEVTKRAKVPLISLIQAGEMTDVLDLFHPGEAVHWVEALYTHPSKGCYSLKVEGDSMESPIQGAQTFLEGTILIVDPNAASGPNDYVIAKDVVTQKATFKKLTTDGVRWYLKPLNPNYPIAEIDDPALRVIGKVIEFQPPGGKL